MDSCDSLTQVSGKYQDILKKVKEARREKHSNDSFEKSFGRMKKYRKKRNELSKSFLANALSIKNKQLVTSLASYTQLVQQLEQSVRAMQHTQMALRIKLNSREVELEKATEKINKLENGRTQLSNVVKQARDLFSSAASILDEKDEESINSIMFSAQPRRIAVEKPAPTNPAENDKWHPDLTMIQERSLAVPNRRSSDISPRSSRSSMNESWASDINTNNQIIEQNLELHISRRKSSRRGRQSSLFSLALLSDNEEEEDEKYQHELETESPTKQSQVNVKAVHFATNENPDKDLQTNKEKNDDSSQVRLEIRNWLNTKPGGIAENLDSAISEKNMDTENKNDELPASESVLLSSMELTAPIESSIIVGNAPTSDEAVLPAKTKPSKSAIKLGKRVSFGDEQTKGKRRSKQKENGDKKVPKKKPSAKKNMNLMTTSENIFNLSQDSFITNPEKKIKLKQKSLDRKTDPQFPMSDLTNAATNCSRRRRTTPVSYKEPSLNSKLRREDKLRTAKS